MSLLIAQYRGKSFLSDAIKLLTYSDYSHSAVLFTQDMEVESGGRLHFIAEGSVIEAWTDCGVRLTSSLSQGHSPNTRVDLFDFKRKLAPEQSRRVAATLIAHLGQSYSYGNVARFVPIVRALMPKPLPFSYTRTHVFCSELVLEAFSSGGVHLLERCKYWEIPPRDVARSPLLFQVKTVYTAK